LILQQWDASSSYDHDGAGLYHIAYLHTTRAALVHRISNILQHRSDLFEWSADHEVSEAFYFHDPEWNGIELYYDKDPSTRVWSNGTIRMWSYALDVWAYLRQYHSNEFKDEVKIWHNHLQIGDLDEAKRFYSDLLGFDVTMDAREYGALFVSVAHYHHHLGLNVWRSLGAGPSVPWQLWLWTMCIQLASNDDLIRLYDRLQHANYVARMDDNKLYVSDPRNNQLVVGVMSNV
jgi:catechol 2,3-dioxygenase